MAYHVSGLIGSDFASRFRNTFIMRAPKAILSSLYKRWSDFTFEKAGYEDLHCLFWYAACGRSGVHLGTRLGPTGEPGGDSHGLLREAGYPFHARAALCWTPREVPEWKA